MTKKSKGHFYNYIKNLQILSSVLTSGSICVLNADPDSDQHLKLMRIRLKADSNPKPCFFWRLNPSLGVFF
jgi:hypothetical protein